MRRGWDFFAAGLCLAVFIFASRREVQQGAGASVDTPKLATLETEQNNLGSSDDVTVVCLGDSHSKHADFTVPAGEVLLHSGDFSMWGRKSDVVAFNEWLGKLPHRHKIVVAGNHDSGRTGNRLIFKDLKQLLSNAVYLVDETVELPVGNGKVLRVFGSPWQPQYRGFHSFKSESELESLWLSLESDRRPDVVLTHTPPFSLLDQDTVASKGIGSTALLKMVADRKPLLHCFGHIHTPGGGTLSVEHSDLNRETGAQNGKAGELMVGEGRTLFVNDALATNKMDSERVYTMRKGAHPISIQFPSKLLKDK
jgi:predicted phosphohydrolase